MTPAMHLHAIIASYAGHKQSRQIRYDLERAHGLGQEFGTERAAQVVDHCNKEGPS